MTRPTRSASLSPRKYPTGTAGASSRSPRSTGTSAALDELRQLTERDRYVLEVLAEHQVLTAEQIARLKFTDENTARKRLILLHRRRVLDRFRDGVRPGSQAWRYTLGPVGAAIIAAGRGTAVPRPATHAERVLRLARSPRLNHLLGVNEFFVALAAAARNDPRHCLAWWLNERRATALCAGLARPDSLGTWTFRQPGEHQEITFFLEHDTGTEPLQRLTTKLPGYAEAHLGGGPDHPVLFWLPSHEREHHLHRLLEQRGSPVPVATAVHPATRVHHDPTQRFDPSGQIWLIPGEQVRHRLVDLAAVLEPNRRPPDEDEPTEDEADKRRRAA
jgi:hypothetical protein